ncbi:bifunctional helix-turn-helix transcriptional regulator/GNAT family N-acetyltransferase [Sinorhizobium fredii]|uniref:bifunctional helix-turn-helix transcriptional regulator/GNAT family N-acetyltransferase n=1 Tax=Rhizobium fredii TaxID=380 RepID=UPI001296C7FE|nr:helix-turn-helix domain-containing GNAT family N-acetyltransferase [Sinorhizobium fredii]MQW97971.1 GNAT family N-acetyltransferase [Sinorhizobium fredii]UTY45662.1 MarR family transcriptional regulator [Sinorhizobium fredii]
MSLHNHDQDVAALRAFNRLYTRRLGLLNPRLDKSPFTLTEARILYELAHRAKPTAAEITRALGLDRAQLSRTLKRFIDKGLIETSEHPQGGRGRPLSLTKAGRNVFAGLDRNTRDAIGALLDALPPGKRSSLLSAAKSIGKVFEESPAAEIVLRDPRPGDLGWIIHRQAKLYSEEYGWNGDYEALAARILADFVQSFDRAHEAAWIAEIDGRIVGSIFLMRGDRPEVGKLRLLYVEPEARGAGVGAMLVDACIERARAVGYERLVLWTNSVLVAARRLYERAGFKLIDETPHHSFGHDLVGQTWSLDIK